MYVYLDLNCEKNIVSGLLFENSNNFNFSFKKCPAKLFSQDKSGRFTLMEDQLPINKTKDGIIVLTEKNMARLVTYNAEKQNLVISLYHSNLSISINRYAAIVVYAAARAMTDNLYNQEVAVTPDSLIDSVNNTKYKSVIGRLNYNELPSPVHVVITHGIRTHAEWSECAHNILDNRNISTSIFRYEWVDVVKFAFNIRVRKKYAVEFLKRLNIARQTHPKKQLSVAVHSFGSIVLATALELADKIECRLDIDSVILSGSILPSNFVWLKYTRPYKNHGVSIRRVLNVCGDNDIWPVIAKYWTKQAGYSGAFFFSDNYSNGVVNTRIKDADHESILSKENIENNWCRFLLSDYEYKIESNAPKKRLKRVDYISLAIIKFVFPSLLLFIFLYWLW